MAESILILGGGVGGLVAARRLRKLLPKRHRITLVERESSFSLAASFLWVMNGTRNPAQVSRPLTGLARRGVEVVQGEVERIEPASRKVVVNGRTLSADHLIVALGAEFVPSAVPGLAEGGYTFCDLRGAMRLREALRAFESGAVVVLTAAPAYKCPAAPYEAAMLLAAEMRARGLAERVKIALHTAEPAPMGVAGPDVSTMVSQMVREQGVEYHPAHQVTRVLAEDRRVEFADGESVPFDLLIYVPPIAAPKVVRDAGLVNESGWMPVDRHTMLTAFPNVYAVGDVTAIPLSMGKPLPKAGVFAHGQAEVVARNIADAILGKERRASFDGHGSCFIETGEGKAGYGGGNFYAEPKPEVTMRAPSVLWHAGKVAFEKYWFWSWL
jgi:sulfide:quinone oxidoreductase